MKIGVCRIQLRLPENGSLKGKRRVIKSISSRVASKFNVAIAEVDDNELWQLVTLGISCVGNNTSHLNEVLSRAVSFIEQMRMDAELLDYEIEIIDSL